MKLRADLGNGQSESLESFAVGYRFLTLPRPLRIDYGPETRTEPVQEGMKARSLNRFAARCAGGSS
jgi:hypothetical protein